MMVATAPTKSTHLFSKVRGADVPDLAYFRHRYPETVANLGTLPRREEWLRRIWESETRWRAAWETRGGEPESEEVIVNGPPPAGRVAEAEFDVIYAGGAAALLHAAMLARGHGRRVLVLGGADEGEGSVWNLSDEELKELEGAGLFTSEEAEAAVLNRYRGGFVKFHDDASRVKAEPLWVSGALDVAVDATRLLALAAERLGRAKGCAVIEGLRFVRAYIEPSRVTVETEGAGSGRRFFAARLFADASGADSALARQLNGAGASSHVRPSVGTIARGYVRGEGRGEADFRTGEILVSTEDASAHRQLMWEGFAGSPARGDYATRLFFYDTTDSPADKSLLMLFERYFESLPSYKRRGAGWRVERPLFGYAHVAHGGWRRRGRAACERVMVVGGGAGHAAGAFNARGEGLHACDLRRVARLTDLALASGAADADTLSEICDGGEARVARAVGLADFMRHAAGGAPHAVNETLNALMAALGGLDERVRREVFQGRMSTRALRRLLARTARLYPRIFARVREHFGARGTLCWLADVVEAVWSERGKDK
ncbi:MAG: lycopene cyclase CruA [Acidobacteriota bacterium]|jgi:lycopene cyclase CruA|nr:lycopene cyclase CruA [Acidobacteriota bacterium]